MQSLSCLQLSKYLAVTKRTVQRRAMKEQWSYTDKIALGGTTRIYRFDSLPDIVKSKIVAAIIAGQEKPNINQQRITAQLTDDTSLLQDIEQNPTGWLSRYCDKHQTDRAPLNKDYVRLGILALARGFKSECRLGKIARFELFCLSYNKQALQLSPAVYAVVKSVSRISLLRWEKREYSIACASLGITDKALVIDKDLASVIKEIQLITPNINGKRLRQHFLILFPNKTIPTVQQLELLLR
jgi:hypothetical protein